MATTSTAPKKKQFVMTEKKVDRFNTIRIRRPLTPAVCEQCGFDVIYFNELPEWDRLSQREKEDVKQAVAKHIEQFHTPDSARIIDEDELSGEWLGATSANKKGIKLN